ncbi:hypothetical protein FRB99_007177 [Tulasnella sp. 403]|nr:hypothetical protein FRB99_007177 [Tulasnella sp. 403]
MRVLFPLLGLSISSAVSVVADRHHTTSRSRTLSAAKNATNDKPPPLPNYFFDQLLDHTNPSLGTFKQRYFFNDTLWKGQGSPIVILNPGEQSADGFDLELTSLGSLQRALMESIGAAGVVIEHRYWGLSSPFQNLTTDNMKYLFLNQAIEDTKYFAENVQLPWSRNNAPTVASSHPADVPWVHMGCSYPGLLAAYTQEKYPDTFAASWASSAPVEAQGDFWQYYEPIEEGMPKNCSSDAALVVKTVDQTLLNGTAEAKAELKKSFGLESLRDDDFGYAISAPIGDWQEMLAGSYNASGEDLFFRWCDAMEKFPNGTVNTSPEGVGLPHASEGYASFFKKHYPEKDCPGQGGACYTTYDYTSDMYTNWTVDNAGDRQWMWMTCNEFGWWQDGDPGNYSSIVSSLVTADWALRQCNYMFPNANGTPGNYNPNVAGTNAIYNGWNLTAQRLFVVNGQYDPWRSASLSSIWAPQMPASPLQPIEVVAGGHHCWDYNIRGAYFDPDIKRVVDLGIDTGSGVTLSERFKHYAPSIQTIFVNPSIDRWILSTSACAKWFLGPTLFPNLQHLTWNMLTFGSSTPFTIDLFLSSSLKTLRGIMYTKDPIRTGSFIVDVLRTLATRRAQLESFEIYTAVKIEPSELSSIITQLQGHPLRRVSFRVSGRVLNSTHDPSSLIKFLGEMDGLKSLTISSHDEKLSRPLPPQQFQALESIDVSCHNIANAQILASVSSTKLKSVRIQLPRGDGPFRPENGKPAFEAFSRFGYLRRVDLNAPWSSVTFDDIYPIVNCQLVELIHWDVPTNFGLGSAQLKALLSAWPHLRVFSIGQAKDAPFLTADDMLLFAKLCPLLEQIHLSVDFTALDAGVPSATPALDRVTIAGLRYSIIGRKPENLARFIYQLWPNLESLYSEEPSRQQWNRVREKLAKLTGRAF